VEQTIVFCRLLCPATRQRQTTNDDGLPHASDRSSFTPARVGSMIDPREFDGL
jgi:hypothetical protein